MGSFTSLAAVGLSITTMLDRRLDAAWTANHDLFRRRPKAQLVRTEQFSRKPGVVNAIDDGTVSVFCYRADINKTMRPPYSAVSAATGKVHVPVDLRFLFTAWESDAEAELRLIGFTLLTLEATPILTGPLLHPAGVWSTGETIELVNEDLVTEDVLRTFETLGTDFRLSVSYIARVVRLDADVDGTAPDVVTAIAGLTPSPVPS